MRRTAWAALLLLGGCASVDPHVQEAKRLVRGNEPVVAGNLEGGPWLVEDVNGGGVIDNARLEMTFGDDRVTGKAGCNNFNGAWQQDGAAVRFGPLMITRKACPPALMMLEAKLLSALEAATTVAFDATGAATLTAPDGRRVKLRRDQTGSGA